MKCKKSYLIVLIFLVFGFNNSLCVVFQEDYNTSDSLYFSIDSARKYPLQVRDLQLNSDDSIEIDDDIINFKNLKYLQIKPFAKIKKFSTNLYLLPNLEKIEIAGMGISEEITENIFDGISKLRNLKSLELSGLLFSRIPKKIFDIQSLERIILDNVVIIHDTFDFDSISLPKSLKSISFRNINVLGFWKALKNMPYLEKMQIVGIDFDNTINDFPILTNLTELTMIRCNLKSIDPIIKKLLISNKIRKLIFPHNRISKLPFELSQLINLEILEMPSNSIYEINLDLSKTKISQIDFSDNLFNEIPTCFNGTKFITTMNFESNFITIIPEWIFDLDKLHFLNVAYNLITDINIPRRNGVELTLSIAGQNIKSIISDNNRISSDIMLYLYKVNSKFNKQILGEHIKITEY